MPIDPTGTGPQAVPQAEQPETVAMKCKKCDSISAVELKIPGAVGQRLYRCAKCGFTRGINVGGDPGF